VDEQRSARTNATVDQLLDRYLDVLKIEDKTRASYERLIRLHIRQVLGSLSIGRVNGETVGRVHQRRNPSDALVASIAAPDRKHTLTLRRQFGKSTVRVSAAPACGGRSRPPARPSAITL
jgi:hypothetical protein